MVELKPIYQLPPDQVQAYWQTLYMHDLLKYRIGDVEDPDWTTVMDMILHSGHRMHGVLENEELVADVMLGDYANESTEVHFSMAPGLGITRTVRIARKVAEIILSWPNIRNLYGVTSIYNRTTVLLALRAGFRKVAVIEDSSFYLGHPTAGVMLTYG